MGIFRNKNVTADAKNFEDPKGYTVDSAAGTPIQSKTAKQAHQRDAAVNGNKSKITNNSNPNGNPRPSGWFE